jgi:hypothetical protein
MRCDQCDHWLTTVLTTYDDGETIINFQASQGFGKCGLGLKLAGECTPADFGCAKFVASGWDHTTKHHKAGAAWQHWEVKQCPDCIVAGHSVGCKRCAGTGKVRFYDDGYVGEEQTRLHPKQKALMELGPPKCISCQKELDPNWVSCPWCGTRTNKPGEREVIGYAEGQMQGTTDDMIAAAIAKKHAQTTVPSGQEFNPPPAES